MDVIITRAEAKSQGISTYFTGKLCKHGHLSPRDTKTGQCLECRTSYSKQHYHNNKDRYIEWSAAYRERNRDDLRDYNNRWRKEHPEQSKQHAKQTYEKNKDKRLVAAKKNYHDNIACRKQSAKQWQQENREKCQEICRNYRANNSKQSSLSSSKYRSQNKEKYAYYEATRRASKKQACPDWLTEEHHQQMLDIYTKAVSLTEQSELQYHVDHIVPLQSDLVCGLHVPWNLQIIIASDNLKKSNKLM